MKQRRSEKELINSLHNKINIPVTIVNRSGNDQVLTFNDKRTLPNNVENVEDETPLIKKVNKPRRVENFKANVDMGSPEGDKCVTNVFENGNFKVGRLCPSYDDKKIKIESLQEIVRSLQASKKAAAGLLKGENFGELVNLDKLVEDSYLDKNNDFKTPYQKMSEEEQDELKSLLEKSKQISSAIDSRKKNENPINETTCHCSEMFPNEKLIKEWKEYTERVNMFMAKHPKLPKYIVKAFMLDEYPGDENKQDEQCLGGVKWDVAEFEKITTQMFETYKKKNADYGSSFDDLFDEFGMTSALIRMKDKYNRLKSITEKKDIQVKDESVEDTLLDLANYCILTVLKLRKDRDFKHASKFKK